MSHLLLQTSSNRKMPTTSSRPSGLARFSRSNASSSGSSLSQTVPTPNQTKSEANIIAGNTTNSMHALKIGDRVVIGGNKEGTLRYFGSTHFAKGEWAGIELDKPVGKNDGSVEGKRYDACFIMVLSIFHANILASFTLLCTIT